MTRQEIIDYCLTLPAAYEDYPFDEVVDDNACTVMRHRKNKKSFALIMRHNRELYLNLKCEPLEADFLRSIYKRNPRLSHEQNSLEHNHHGR